jgi:methylisocitrate lyase
MPWLVHPPAYQADLRRRFDALLAGSTIVRAPGVYNGLVARLAADAGFEMLYLSGAALSAARCVPDIGLLTSDDLAEATREIVRASQLPLIVDADTGGGSVVNAARLARELQDAGAAALQIEDQQDPKRCGHLAGKRLIPVQEMTARLRAARATAPSLAIVARSDARAVEGLDALIERCRAYAAAGADCIFPEALTSREEFAAVRAALDRPLLANMTEFGVSPLLSAAELESLGYQVVIYPVSLLRAAAFVTTQLLTQIAESGTTAGWLDRMQTRQALYATLRYDAYARLEDQAYGVQAAMPAHPSTGSA